MYRSLEKFIERLEAEGELYRVSTHVDTQLEMSEIVDRVSKACGERNKALLFENTGSGFPVLANMMGSERRMALACGVGSVGELGEGVEGLLGEFKRPRRTLWDKLKLISTLKVARNIFPRRRRGRGECQQVVLSGDAINLEKLPIPKTWPHDGGRYITLPLVHTLNPNTGETNVGMYRMQVLDKATTGMHWQMHKTGERHYQIYKQRGERMPVTVCLGGDPAYTYAATAPLPEGIDEYMLAGYLRRKPVRLVKCLTNELWVPEDCDFVLEGYVDPMEDKVVEGPFGDHTGFYSLKDLYPRFHITAITHRRRAIYPMTLVGVPPQEDRYIALASEQIFSTPIKTVVASEILDITLPWQGVAHNLVCIQIEKTFPNQGMRVASAIWGAWQMSFCKMLWIGEGIIDEDFVRDALLGKTSFRAGITTAVGVADALDHAGETAGLCGKICFDTTADNSNEWRTEVVFDEGTENLSDDDKLWLLLGNTDPQRDITMDNGIIKIDARLKKLHHRQTPNIVTMNQETIELVDSRWGEYNLGGFIESPSLRYQKLVKNNAAEQQF